MFLSSLTHISDVHWTRSLVPCIKHHSDTISVFLNDAVSLEKHIKHVSWSYVDILKYILSQNTFKARKCDLKKIFIQNRISLKAPGFPLFFRLRFLFFPSREKNVQIHPPHHKIPFKPSRNPSFDCNRTLLLFLNKVIRQLDNWFEFSAWYRYCFPRFPDAIASIT